MNLQKLDMLLNNSPVILRSDPLSALYLGDVQIVDKFIDFKTEFDKTNLIDICRIIVTDSDCPATERVPEVLLDHNPYSIPLNEILFANYLGTFRYGFSQKDIAKTIIDDTSIDSIILVLVDGLSYDDCKDQLNVHPCLVNGASITPVGFRNIIGTTPIAYRLFSKGFKKRIGFSYWDRDNPLTNELFRGFDPILQMNKIDEFEQIVNSLRSRNLTKTFIQIGMTGLDQLAHRYRDRPMKKEWVNKLFSEYIVSLESVLVEKGLSAKIYLTADHGIWWRPTINEQQAIVLPKEKACNHPRYLEGTFIRNNVVHTSCYGHSYSLLRYPYVFRNFKNNEWGMHGGISYFESVVPFYRKEIN